jgi:hypothetical protein
MVQELKEGKHADLKTHEGAYKRAKTKDKNSQHLE